MAGCRKERKIKFQTGSFTYFFVLFFSVIVMPVLAFGGVFAWQFKKESHDDVVSTANQALECVFDDVEELIGGIERTAQQYVTSNWVRKITYIQGDKIPVSRVSTEDYKDYTQNLQIAVLNNTLTDMSAIVFTSKDFVVSSDGIASADVFFSSVYKSDVTYDTIKGGEWLRPQILISQTGINAGVHWPPVSAGKVMFYICKLLESSSGDTLFVSYMPIKEVSRVLSNRFDGAEFGLSVSLADGQTIYQDNWGTGYEIEKAGRFFTYKLFIPEQVFASALAPMMQALVGVLILLIAVTALTAFTISLKQVKRMLSLEKSLNHSKSGEADKFSISYATIEHDAMLLNLQNADISTENAVLRPLAINQLLLRLLTGSEREAHTALDRLREYNVLLNRPMFMIMNVCMNAREGTFKDENEIEMVERHFNDNLPVFTVAVRAPSIQHAFLINCGDDVSAQSVMSGAEEYFVHEYGAEFGVLMFSNMYSGVAGAQAAFREIKKLNDYRLLNEQYDVRTVTFNQAQYESAIFYYPSGAENRLVQALTDGDAQMIDSTLKDIFARNGELKWMSSNQIHILLFSLIYTARRALGANNVHTRLYINFPQVQDINSIEDASIYASRLFAEVMEMIKDERAHSDDNLGIKLKAFVDSNFRQQELSLAMLSAETGKPEYIISREFKRRCGIGFAEYVQNLRISEAQKLIAHGCRLKDLAQMVGFGSDITFRRAFKKVTMQLPSEYIEAISQEQSK